MRKFKISFNCPLKAVKKKSKFLICVSTFYKNVSVSFFALIHELKKFRKLYIAYNPLTKGRNIQNYCSLPCIGGKHKYKIKTNLNILCKKLDARILANLKLCKSEITKLYITNTWYTLLYPLVEGEEVQNFC